MYTFGRASMCALALATMAFTVPSAYAQDSEQYEDIEEIVVTGSQIRGARITDALAVSILSAEDIEAAGVTSGDELLALFTEHGQNFFSEAENISGGVNSARGDVGAFNLRNLGTGNTLVLVNGRRVVNDAGFQTEEIGGSFVPVTTANSNALPVSGLARVEVLRDGASAIYGADAVAGVINTVLQNNFEGLRLSIKNREYDDLSRGGLSFNLKWGIDFDNGANLGVYVNTYSRDAVNSQDDPRWANADFRYRIPADSPWAGNTRFRNTSINSIYGQFDLVSSASGAGLSGVLTDSAGEFEVFPAGDSRCQYVINTQVCGARDGQGVERYNLNENRDLSSELDRTNIFVYFNHTLDSGLELFSEASFYSADSSLVRHPSASFSSVRLRVGASNYYNPFGPTSSPNRLADSVLGSGHNVPDEGLQVSIDNYRFTEVPRLVEVESSTYRLLQGFRGTVGAWDWEAAALHSVSTRDDVTHNRVSNTLMQEALNDSTSAAYNPFSGGVNSNIQRALVSVYRNGESTLTLLDAKFTHNDLFEVGGGSAGLLLGAEHRSESFVDDRDPRLDGTIRFIDHEGDTYPFVSDVVNSSPTPDNRGDRDVLSLFAELALPLTDTLDLQAALRFEDYSDVDSALVGKVAFGWDVSDSVKLRGSWSQAHRVPNLVTINETTSARSLTREDYVCHYASDRSSSAISAAADLDCRYQIQRRANGSRDLVSEESDNLSLGVVLQPVDDMVVTLDYWSIEKSDTIGLFGEENHTILELYRLIEAGTGSCSTFSYSPVDRQAASTLDASEVAVYTDAGICPRGTINSITSAYENLDTRKLAGYDVGFQYRIDTNAGRFTFKYNLSQLDEYEQSSLWPGCPTSGSTSSWYKSRATLPHLWFC